MTSVLRIPGQLSDATTIVVSLGVTTTLGAVGANLLVRRNTDEAGFEAAAVMAGLVAFTCFAGALALIRLSGRLRPALWGYLPGLAAVLAAGLLLSESGTRATEGAVSPFAGAFVLLLPSTWIPIYAAVKVQLETRREDVAARSWRGRH